MRVFDVLRSVSKNWNDVVQSRKKWLFVGGLSPQNLQIAQFFTDDMYLLPDISLG